jgi:hypothetical protein
MTTARTDEEWDWIFAMRRLVKEFAKDRDEREKAVRQVEREEAMRDG